MNTGRIGRTARRGVAVLTLGWLLAMAGSVLAAPTASAAASVTVAIRDLTPPVASVDAGGTVTFVNQIADKNLQVGGGGLLPALVNVTAKTDVTLRLPSGSKPLPAGASVSETFAQSCVGYSITYAYRVVSGGPSLTQGLIDATLGQLPALPLPTPFVVNTLVPLPNLPSVNLPALPPVTVPAPAAAVPVPVPAPGGGGTPAAEAPAAGAPAVPTTAAPVDGTGYAYGLPTTSGQLAPMNSSAAAAFDPSRFVFSDAASTAGGSGGGAGSYDGASVPVFGQLAGLGGSSLAGSGDDVEIASDSAASGPDPALSVPALAAVIALAGVTAALVRTHLSQRAANRTA